MLTYDEFKEAMDNGFIKGDTVQIVRKNGKIHDYVLDGEQVEPHEILSLEKVSDIIKELGVSKTYIEKIIRVVNIHSELLKKRIDYF
ncbi:Paratox [Streptococcus infantarius subsp. infantarius]|jgi:DNA-directed RNA polymerase subunit H (RpoH/RPB5)|uniref:competence regulator inhibitor paratox n=1 Tax=Streptococcus infantarius TaxID=102684 RepID=UPI001BD94F73|nr:Paratox [Streptococcus infantarius]MBT0931185.1 Paratox [Streptococcus infantarius subsp. infantarius]MCO4512487.1 Paratox [Streptococcus infantarius subsp. infantarius]MCO4514525.1 Paratox [Streptococcus infantarius subsp. infantarius]MCO4516590.1 Paratox [Streptococcus infantarius subsp. infantarius]MCO4576863.1 Paratox [Streptococcus infantarius subsp. infantarius]